MYKEKGVKHCSKTEHEEFKASWDSTWVRNVFVFLSPLGSLFTSSVYSGITSCPHRGPFEFPGHQNGAPADGPLGRIDD